MGDCVETDIDGVSAASLSMFSDEELNEISGLKRGLDYIEVTCGCTSHRYGDAVGRLRVFINGDLEISCECTSGCQEDTKIPPFLFCFGGTNGWIFRAAKIRKHHVGHFSRMIGLCFYPSCESGEAYLRSSLGNLIFFPVRSWRCHSSLRDKLTPAAFEKHAGRETARKWKSNVWVIKKGSKVPLFKTALLKYYEQALKETNKSSLRSLRGRACHRDEFVRCTRCNKSRRFHLTSKEEYRIHHDASIDANWKCSDLPLDNLSCEDDEERASRRVYRGCSRSQTCSGCTTCVCFGCDLCRFSDCNCQTCLDFTRNAKP